MRNSLRQKCEWFWKKSLSWLKTTRRPVSAGTFFSHLFYWRCLSKGRGPISMELPFLRHFFPHLQAWKSWKLLQNSIKKRENLFFQELKSFVFNPQQNWHVNWFFNKTIFPKNPNSFECRPKKIRQVCQNCILRVSRKILKTFLSEEVQLLKILKISALYLSLCNFGTSERCFTVL